MMLLTLFPPDVNLLLPFFGTAGFRSSDNISLQRPQFNVAFLCLLKKQAAVRRLRYLMVARNGQPVKRLAGPDAGTANLLRVAVHHFAVVGGSLPKFIRKTVMNTHTQVSPGAQPTPATTRTNLFPHRFDADKAHDPAAVYDAFSLIACHAQGVLNSLFFQFEGDGRMSDECILGTIDSVCFMIDDMKAIINAHIETAKAGKDGAE